MKEKVIVIVGPTASGKTDLAIQVAKKINGEIVSADSMQVYREMDIGTAKPTLLERQEINHYMIDCVSPEENFSVSKYKKMSETCLGQIIQNQKTPILVGGTGLYVDSLIKGMEFTEMKNDLEYRAKLEQEAREKGIESLFLKLQEIDPEAAKHIDKNNVRRVIRALEIYKITGKTKTQWDLASLKGAKYEYLLFGLLWEREKLYERINSRVDQMLENGLVEEVRRVSQKYCLSQTALQGLGYKEVLEYLKEEISYEEMVEKIKIQTRHYAKRQMTWFRRYKNITWLDAQKGKENVQTIQKAWEA